MKVLVISTNAIGDTYLSASVIQTILDVDTNVKIDMITDKNSAFLLEDLQTNNVFQLLKRNIFHVFALVKKLRRKEYDYVFSFFPGRINSIFFKLIRGKRKAGFINFRKVNDWYISDSKLTVSPRLSEKYIWHSGDNYLKRIELCLEGVKLPYHSVEKPLLSVNKKASDKLILAPFSNDSRRELSIPQIIYLIDALTPALRLDIFILYGNNDEEKINSIRSNTLDAKVIKGSSLIELTELISNNILIAVDSFPIHIADAYESNFIGLFSVTSPESVLRQYGTSIKYNEGSLSAVSESRLVQDILGFLPKRLDNHE